MKKFALIIGFLMVVFNLTAQVSLAIIYKDNGASYSIQWDKSFAQINNLIPEIKTPYQYDDTAFLQSIAQ